MSLAKIQTSEQTSVRVALRRATNTTHQRMHGLEPFARIAAGTLLKGQYQNLLQSLYLFHSAVGKAAHPGRWSHFSRAEQRLELLRSDLTFLGGSVPEPAGDWQAGPHEALIGALYAAEGSILGGRVIARQLDYAFGSGEEGRRFFIGSKEDYANWSRLMVVLEETCGHAGPLSLSISGAIRTFEWFEECVTFSFRGSSRTRQSNGDRSPLCGVRGTSSSFRICT